MKRESGFTLLEVLLVATLLGMIVAVIVPNLGVGFRIWSSTGESMEIIQDSRITLQKMMKDIRNAEEITDISSESISLIDENGDSIDYGLFYSDGEPYLG
ncbi:TPA: type II secretion system protein, partial [Candidatus Poribacteria bacterium]|nr:type II secretion system protein [Candidatus Poribacteria bacterium]HEX30314.1 type II secretion system protein [Candidatus Poribacteria bacterium]